MKVVIYQDDHHGDDKLEIIDRERRMYIRGVDLLGGEVQIKLETFTQMVAMQKLCARSGIEFDFVLNGSDMPNWHVDAKE